MHNTPETKQILIIKNNTDEGPGIIEEIIRDYAINYTIADFSSGEAIPDVINYGAVIILGGPDSANDDNLKMKQELDLIRRVTSEGIPYLGICLGLQTLVRSAGGKVVKCPLKETGFRDQDGDFYTLDLTEEGRKDPLFNGLGNTFRVFHLHGETVELTEKMILLGTGKNCRNQAVRTGINSYGMQCHLELTPEMFEVWITSDPDLMKFDRDKLRSDFEESKDFYYKNGKILFQNFLHIAGLI